MGTLVSLLASSRQGSRSSTRRALQRRGSWGPSSRQLWLAVAAGSVALLLLAARRRQLTGAATKRPARVPLAARDAGSAEPGTADVLGSNAAPNDVPLVGEPGSESHPSTTTLAVKPRASRAQPAPLAADLGSRGAVSSLELPLPGVHRAAVAITLGRPAELRRLARDLQRAGQDTEAGLVENYALLLERVPVSRERVLTEVTRMLRAAAAERRSARRTAPAIAWPPTAVPRSSKPSEAEDERAQESNGVALLPQLSVGQLRRTAR